MWEYAVWAGLAILIGEWNFKPKTDEEILERVFENIGYRTKESKPHLLRKDKKEKYTEYVYNVPYGMVDDKKLEVIQKTFHKPVHIYFDGKLHIRLYKKDLRKRIRYVYGEVKPWSIPLGMAQEGMITHSFDKIPHMTIAGMTRQGKTVLLKLIMAHLIKQHPEDVEFYIIDLKGGLEFERYRQLKQVKKVASNVKEAQETLSSIISDIQGHMSGFKTKGYTNILDTPIKRRTFVIVDEGAELTPGQHHTKEERSIYNECQHALSEIARIAGALGYREIFCTQYPTADTLPRQIKQNSDAKISFRLPTDTASRVAIDEGGANELTCPGRAIYRTHEKKVVQVPLITDKQVWEMVKEYVTEREETESPNENIIEIG